MLHEFSSFCRAFKGFRVHCRDTQMFPVVPRHTFASNIKDPFRIERHKSLLWALKHLISLSDIFFEAPCTKLGSKSRVRHIQYLEKRKINWPNTKLYLPWKHFPHPKPPPHPSPPPCPPLGYQVAEDDGAEGGGGPAEGGPVEDAGGVEDVGDVGQAEQAVQPDQTVDRCDVVRRPGHLRLLFI